ncbi:oxidoreductase [Nautilia sp. PV-1]|uniref:NADH-quinone oxidoreductase subunit B family protein n=1 Tax=Nautilia sp. PV-1 TaxID=2579250 RepID=UPI000FDC7575|nr:oxidoreductase [Nautilia sp. PV-1]AZV46269.1 oxidoreductase [Nautilia sp. PV-1]
MMNRREFLKAVHKALIAAGGAGFFSMEELEALEIGDIKKPDIIWLQAMSCDGCSTSFLNADISILDILTSFTNVIFHPTLMAATGEMATDIIEKYKSDNLILVVEGAIPTQLPHACLMGDRFINDWIANTAKKAKAAISAGTCATFAGICDMKGMMTGAGSLRYFLEQENISTPVVNLPTCPMKPNHFLYTLFFYIKHNTLPPMDDSNRPLRFFGETIHDRCVYYYDYQEKNFAEKIGDRGCLFKLGCQGPVTKNDCVRSSNTYDKYNCIKSGHPCVGCASENFPRTIMFKRSDDKREIKKYKTFKRI